MEVQVFRVIGGPVDEGSDQGFGLGNLSEPVNEYQPLEGRIFASPDDAIAHARKTGWLVLRVES
jgi:hypothetical protein